MPSNKFNQGSKKTCTQKNYKTLTKEIEKYTHKSRHIWCSWIGKITFIKMSLLTRAIYRFSAVHIKISMTYFTELEQIFQKLMKLKQTTNSHSNLQKDEQSWKNHAA